MTAYCTFHGEEGSTIPSKPLQVLDLAHFPSENVAMWKTASLERKMEQMEQVLAAVFKALRLGPPDPQTVWHLRCRWWQKTPCGGYGSASCRITQRPWGPGIAVFISNVYAVWKTAPHVRRPLQRPWRDRVPGCGMPVTMPLEACTTGWVLTKLLNQKRRQGWQHCAVRQK